MVSGASVETQVSEPLLRIDAAAKTPIPLRISAQQKLPSKVPLVATQRGATPSKAALQHPYAFECESLGAVGQRGKAPLCFKQKGGIRPPLSCSAHTIEMSAFYASTLSFQASTADAMSKRIRADKESSLLI